MQRYAGRNQEKNCRRNCGGGAVSLVMNGEKQIISLSISKEAIDPEDSEMLEDLITSAVNEAVKKSIP